MNHRTTDQQPPWAKVSTLPPKPPGSDYGYVQGQTAYACSREDLVEKSRKDLLPAITLVWTPEYPVMVPPQAVPFLAPSNKTRAMKRAMVPVILGGIVTLILIIALIAAGPGAFLTHREFRFFMFMGLIFGPMYLFSGLYSVYRIQSGTPPRRGAFELMMFGTWVRRHPAQYTKIIIGVMVAAFVWQFAGGSHDSVYAAGLVKPLFWDGQYWRVITYGFLHAGVLHLWMNMTVLYYLGKQLEAFRLQAWLVPVFLVTSVAGGLLSAVLAPGAITVGASAGILGYLGFLGGLAHRFPRQFPAGYKRSVYQGMGMILAVGLLGWEFIDNWAHIGGFIAGVVMAYFATWPEFQSIRR